jgi:hypothetical protein
MTLTPRRLRTPEKLAVVARNPADEEVRQARYVHRMSAIQLRCKVFPLAFLLYLFKPRFSIDGSPEQIVRWGDNTIPVPPGRHSLRVWYKYITGPTNVADAVIDVPPEGLALVYKTRWLIFLPGKLEPVGPAGPVYGQGAPYGQQQRALPQQQPQQQPYGTQQYAQQYAPQAAQPQPQPQAQPQPQPQPGQAPPAGWNPDPSGRHQHRWWDGSQWTASVADNGVTTDDPL